MLLSDATMSEAEVSINLALYLIRNELVSSDVWVAIDGAQIRTGNTLHFPIEDFMLENRCIMFETRKEWRGTYRVNNADFNIIIHSTPGKGDVVSKLISGTDLRVESKKGPLMSDKSSKEYPLMREAIGQLMTIKEYNESDRLAIAVPNSDKFKKLSQKWKNAPLIKKLSICFLLVGRNGKVEGIEDILY
ncbi:MAG: hypothetical protein PWR29_1936 [Methanolobus sp.]|nr:hypothetical protein [Methanolobus sp.]MDN5309278.1 hypothetical protein [Methanolobus sp.]